MDVDDHYVAGDRDAHRDDDVESTFLASRGREGVEHGDDEGRHPDGTSE